MILELANPEAHKDNTIEITTTSVGGLSICCPPEKAPCKRTTTSGFPVLGFSYVKNGETVNVLFQKSFVLECGGTDDVADPATTVEDLEAKLLKYLKKKGFRICKDDISYNNNNGFEVVADGDDVIVSLTGVIQFSGLIGEANVVSEVTELCDQKIGYKSSLVFVADGEEGVLTYIGTEKPLAALASGDEVAAAAAVEACLIALGIEGVSNVTATEDIKSGLIEVRFSSCVKSDEICFNNSAAQYCGIFCSFVAGDTAKVKTKRQSTEGLISIEEANQMAVEAVAEHIRTSEDNPE